MSPCRYDVLGIGTPIVDLFISVSDEFLKKIGATKGGAVTVDYNTFSHLVKESGEKPFLLPGGSTANTLKGLAHLGRNCAFVGKIGKDEAGQLLLDELKSLNISANMIFSHSHTARVLSLITPDHDRTMFSFLGTGIEIKAHDLKPEMFSSVSLVHIEGYLLPFDSLVQTAMELAKKAGAKVSFNLGSFEITHQYKQTIMDLLPQHVDLLFANAVETEVLTHLNPEKGCEFLKNLCETAIVTMGEHGCWAARGKEKIYQPAFHVPNVIDTTGAGDLFASGFLHEYLSNKSIGDCARAGALIASAVIQNIGVTIPIPVWENLKAQLILPET